MAEHANNQRDYDKAITFYKEALVYNENDGKVSPDHLVRNKTYICNPSTKIQLNQQSSVVRICHFCFFMVEGDTGLLL